MSAKINFKSSFDIRRVRPIGFTVYSLQCLDVFLTEQYTQRSFLGYCNVD
jgi:hypothetical protein